MRFHHFLTPKGLMLRRAGRLRYGTAAPLTREIININPQQIVGERNTPDAIQAHTLFGQTRGLIAEGGWDTSLGYFSFAKSGLLKSCRMRWQQGLPWTQTPAYQSYLSKINAGTPHHDAPTVAALDARYAKLDKIHAQIVHDGKMSEDYEDLITISFNRKGELFWGPNGRHRVCIALSLGLKMMPARVGIIHAEAVDLFQELRTFRKARMRSLMGFYG